MPGARKAGADDANTIRRARLGIGEHSNCVDCPLRTLPICANLVDNPLQLPKIRLSQSTNRPRQLVYRKHQPTRDVFIIRRGWAFRFAVTASGRRQILSFLMPGDLLSAASLYNEKLSFSVEALTDVSYCGFNRDDVQRLAFASLDVARTFAGACAEECMFGDERIVDLGTRSAEERVARLILEIMMRLERRGQVHDRMFDFPLRQQHLADALGLTQVHVNRVLRRLRESGLVELSNGVLKIGDMPALKKLADVR